MHVWIFWNEINEIVHEFMKIDEMIYEIISWIHPWILFYEECLEIMAEFLNEFTYEIRATFFDLKSIRI